MSRLHREMMRLLIAEIVSGQRPAGEMLPREVDLAAEFGVSRGVARECIRAMEERGLISVRHGRGATVSTQDQWSVFDPDVLSAVLEGEGGNELLAEYLECRRIIEVEAAGLAAERADEATLVAAADALDRMEQSAGGSGRAAEERFHEADVSFHQALIRAARNRPLADFAERLHAGLVVARFPLARPQYRQERALPEHRRILDAVASGDVMEARKAMNDHLNTIARYLAEREGGREPERRGAVA
jgi:DNA-binding FadR family transcriptional regulator